MNQNIDIRLFDLIVIILSGVFVLTATALLFVFLLIKNKKSKESHIREKILMQMQFQKELLQTQIEIQEQTLKNISQEIHDNIGQVLSLAKLNLNTLLPDEKEKVFATKELVSKAIHDLRNLSRSLLGEKIAELGLPTAIQNELNSVESTGKFRTSLVVNGGIFNLDAQREIILFRIVQEAISNVIKHAKASSITIHLNYQPFFLELIIQDNGKGFHFDELKPLESGIGLKNMRSRTELLKGKFTIESGPGIGTKVCIHIRFEQ